MTQRNLLGDRMALLLRMLEEEGIDVVGEPDVPRRGGGPVPASFTQRRLWFLDRMQPGSTAYNIPRATLFTGPLDPRALSRALRALAGRHEALRTTLGEVDGQPVQVVAPPPREVMRAVELGRLAPGERDRVALDEVRRLARRPFDLSRGPLFRATLLRMAEDRHALLLETHHVVSDAWSAEIMVRELEALYGAFAGGAEPALPAPGLQYGDFAAWQHGEAATERVREQLAFWERRLAGAPQLELPTDRPRPPVRSDGGGVVRLDLDAELDRGARPLAHQEGTTPFVVLLAAFCVLLSRWSRQADVVVGTPVAGRTRPSLQEVVGFFANVLPLRMDLDGDPGFRSLLRQAREATLEAQSNQDVPFERILEAVGAERSLSHTPLVSVVFGYQEASGQGLRLPGVAAAPMRVRAMNSHFDLNLTVAEVDGRPWLECGYSTDLFEAGTAERLLGQYRELLRGIAADPDRRVGELPLLGAAERAEVLARGRARRTHPVDGTLHGRFAARAASAPGAAAVSFGAETLTYGELEARASALARRLRARGAGPETRVGLCLERGIDLVVGILGILRAGAAYVPLDPAYPAERLRFLVEDSGAALLVTRSSLLPGLPPFAGEAVCLDADPREEERCAGEPWADEVAPENAAYVIYTSGSTGTPKGVVVTHASVLRLFAATEADFRFGADDVWTLFHSFAFDFSVWETWGALLHGGRLVVVPWETSREPEAFRRLLAEEGVTVLNQTPSAFRQLAAADARAGASPELALRWVVFGGEALEPGTLRGWVERHGAERPRLVNMYGITETTVHVTFHALSREEVERGACSPVGEALEDLSLHVLDPAGEPAPTGVPGELCVGGAGAARGYLGRPELTAERFVPDPFSGTAGARLYRSGDLGRRPASGGVEYLGRIDQQVKVRGFRIEPGEIEAVLALHPAVREAVVLVEEAAGERRLAAFLAADADARPDAAALRAFLLERLPEHMVPAAFEVLDTLPLTAHGKVDRRALLARPRSVAGAGGEHVAPRTPAEAALAGVWREVLRVERVGIHDNFFALGGDSILSLRVLALARDRGLALTLPQLFRHQTVAALAATVEEAPAEDEPVPFVRTEPFSLVSAEDRARLPGGVVDAYPLARMQAGMLLHMELTPERPLYHNVDTFVLRRPFRREALEEVARRVVARHAVLRTGFHVRGFSEPLQLVHREARLPLVVEDLRHLPAAEQAAAVRARMQAEAGAVFDLTRPPLLRFHVHLLDEERFQLTLTECHAIFDGWSLTSTLGEIFTLYGALLRGEDPPEEPPAPVAYRDFVALERRTLESPECREWWDRKLAGATPERLPRLCRSGAGGPRRLVQRIVRLPEEVLEGMRRLEAAASVPRRTICLTAHLRVMSLLAGSAEVMTGVTVNGRPETAGGEQVRGLFLNTVPFRHRLPDGSWAEAVRSVFAAEREMLPYRRYPLAALQEARRGEALVESSFNYVNFHGLHDALRSEKLSDLELEEHAETNFTLLGHFGVVPGGRVDVVVVGDAAVLGDELLEALPACYLAVFRALARDPEGRAGELELLEAAERARLEEEWGASARDLPRFPLVHEMVAEHAARAPGAPAVASVSGTLTFGELDARAGRLAARLRELGAGPERRVGLVLERGPGMVVSALAAMRAGAAYLPVDPAYPAERIAWMLEDAGVAAVVTVGRLADRVPELGAPVVVVDADGGIELRGSAPRDAAEPNARPPVVFPENAAYVIYTSGSTGTPRGVVVPHLALANLVRWHARAHGITAADRVMTIAGPGFDASVLDIWPCLAAGACLHPVEDEDVRAFPAALRDWMLERGITVAAMPMPFAERLVAQEWPAHAPLRTLLSGGDALRVRPRPGLPFELGDIYGPTETTVIVTSGHVAPGAGTRPLDIGSAIDNARMYVVDRGLHPMPAGMPGELYVGGVCVARGYLGHPELTADRLVPDPFSREPGTRMYRTGDRARRLADGTLEFLGRTDQQVKIRGFRVELGEVEAALAALPEVREGAVVAREAAPGEVRLAGYAVLREGATAAELRERLRERLPEYMVPAQLVVLDAMPLTPNGKLDRAALPDPGSGGSEGGFAAPRTPVEETLAEIWAEVLGVERVGTDDSFFELGGHSLLATRVASQVRVAFRVELPLRALFDAPTLAGLARHVERLRSGGAGGDEPPPLLPVLRDGSPLPLSFAQQRLWILDRMDPAGTTYNMPLALRLRGPLDPRLLERALAGVVGRHEPLRTVFGDADGEPFQAVQPGGAVPLHPVDLARLPAAQAEAEAARLAAELAWRPFDLRCGPLLRARLLRLARDHHVLALDMHHIVSDGWSMGVFFRETAALYEALARGEEARLPELPVQYADFAAWQRSWLRGETLERQVGWWREQLGGADSAPELPTDHPRPPLPGARSGNVVRVLRPDAADRVRALARREGATLHMVLLAALDVLLARWSGVDDVSVGTPVAGRTRRETEGLIGFFVNTLVLRTDLAGNPGFGELLARVRETTLGAYEHQDVPFERLVDALGVQRNAGRTPLFQVMFSVEDRDAAPVPFAGVEVATLPLGTPPAKFDLSVVAADRETGMGVRLGYRSELWEDATMERLAGAFALLLEGAAADPARPILDLPLLGSAERARLLGEWSAPAAEAPARRCLHELFAAQARRTPGAPALDCGGATVTFAELDRRSNRLANHLRGLGVGPESRVGVCLERGPALVAACLGVLKAGGAYVPLDPAFPAARLGHVLRDAGVAAVLAQESTAGALREYAGPVVRLDADRERIEAQPDAAPESGAGPENLAYVIYTSGSTGAPKGVLVEHGSLGAMVRSIGDAFGFRAGDVLPNLASHAFDIWGMEVWAVLLAGGTVRLVEPDDVRDFARLVGVLAEADVLDAVPELMREVVRAVRSGPGTLPRMRLALIGGDAVPPELVREVRQAFPNAGVQVGYGPTEATIVCAAYRVPEDPAPHPMLGRPFPGAALYVCDPLGTPLPAGVPGELWIGGVGVARGYAGRPELTAEKFVPDPFSGEPGARLYRTGDRVRWRADGQLEFRGRVDRQVKVRGFRIELGEIEAVLRRHPAVLAVAVVVRDGPSGLAGDRRIVAYVEADGISAAEVREWARSSLPEYMVPASVMVLDALPLTPTGKVDRGALPEPESAAAAEDDAEPRTELERAIAAVWAEVLGVARVGTRASFFDLGGNSLLVVRLAARLEAALGREVPVLDVFQHSSVGALARHLAGAEADAEPRAADRERTGKLGAGTERLGRLRRRREGRA